MTVKYQRNRIYSLVVGTKEDAVEVNNLQIKFKVVKTSSNKDKKNSAYIEIYNLSEERRNKLESDYITVSLSVGYTDTGLSNLFTGQVVSVRSSKLEGTRIRRQGTEIITKLDVDELYTQLNGVTLSEIVPAGKTVKDAIKSIATKMEGVTQHTIEGEKVKALLVDGYPLSGTPRLNLDKISRDYGIDWQIDGGTLYVSDDDGSFTKNDSGVPLIGQFSGLIDRPEYINEEAKRVRRAVQGKTPKNIKPKENAIKFKILLNASIVAGSIIKLEFEGLTGYYKVTEVTHEGDFRSNEWYSTLICTERVK